MFCRNLCLQENRFLHAGKQDLSFYFVAMEVSADATMISHDGRGYVQRRKATLKAAMRIVWDSGFLCYYAEPWCYGCQVVYSKDNTVDCAGCIQWITLEDIESWMHRMAGGRRLDSGWSPCRSLVVHWPSHCGQILTNYHHLRVEPATKDLAILPTSVRLYDAHLLNTQASHFQTMHSLFMRLCKRRYYFKRMSWNRSQRREFLDFLKSEEVHWCETWNKCETWRLLLAELT
jgi:hypothetical protein